MSGPGTQVVSNNVIPSILSFVGSSPIWVKTGVGLAFPVFQTAATTININLFTLPIGGIIHATKIKHSTAFSGGAIATCTLSVGIGGTVNKYATAFDVFQAVSGTAFQITTTTGAESMTATTQITATMTSSGANLSALTAGQVDVWSLLSIAS